ncbi:MAG: MATE family efflux transporter [Lachnospiraceae bacterium]|jgi:putative MATE family efflux protein|nr:MATE family efflux transporter [Lachnospiraceae bacterium]
MNQNELLGTKKIGPLLAQMALPAITAQVVNMLYNIVDRIYIGHIPDIGAMALTGVGLCFPILMIITAFSSLIGMGGAPRVSMKLGKKENEGAETVMGGCFAALLVLAVVLTAAFLICGKPLLYLFGASENTIGYAQGYMNIYVMGTLFVMIALGMNPFITAQGFSTISMLTTLIGAIVNIVLDPVFIFVLGMGVQGAALATILSQCVSAVWVMYFLTGRKTVLRLKKRNIRLRASVILPVLALGVSPFIMTSTESLLNICFNTSLQKFGGDMAVGAMTIMSSVMQMMSLPIQGLAQGAQPIVSFNYGAGKLDRVKQAFFRLFWISVVVSTGFWALNMLIPTLIPSIFAGNAELKEISGWANRIYMGGAFMLGVQFSCQQTFIALGEAKISLFLAFLRKIILLIPLIFILPNFFGDKVFAVFLAEPVADILAATTTFGMFAWKFKKIMAKV